MFERRNTNYSWGYVGLSNDYLCKSDISIHIRKLKPPCSIIFIYIENKVKQSQSETNF